MASAIKTLMNSDDKGGLDPATRREMVEEILITVDKMPAKKRRRYRQYLSDLNKNCGVGSKFYKKYYECDKSEDH